MRTQGELEEAFNKVGQALDQPDAEDDPILQAIYDTLRWVDGAGFDTSIEQYLP